MKTNLPVETVGAVMQVVDKLRSFDWHGAISLKRRRCRRLNKIAAQEFAVLDTALLQMEDAVKKSQ